MSRYVSRAPRCTNSCTMIPGGSREGQGWEAGLHPSVLNRLRPRPTLRSPWSSRFWFPPSLPYSPLLLLTNGTDCPRDAWKALYSLRISLPALCMFCLEHPSSSSSLIPTYLCLLCFELIFAYTESSPNLHAGLAAPDHPQCPAQLLAHPGLPVNSCCTDLVGLELGAVTRPLQSYRRGGIGTQACLT